MITIDAAIESLARTFIERQQLVFNVITALRPDMFSTYDKSITIEQRIEMMSKYSHIPQIGIWQFSEGTWDYFFHGKGCRLTHQQTGEIIDWDAPDVEVFDRWKFMFWITWAIETNPAYLQGEVQSIKNASRHAESVKAVVNATLDDLVASGRLGKVSQWLLYVAVDD